MAYIFNDPNDQNHKIWGQLDFVIFRFEYKYNTTIIPIYTRKKLWKQQCPSSFIL